MRVQKFKWYCKENRHQIAVVIAILAALVVTGLVVAKRGLEVKAKVTETQAEIAKEVLRFHILANSDSEEDQALKMKVKDAVLSFMKQELPHSGSLKETKEWVKTHIGDIEELAAKVIQNEGYAYEVRAEVMTCDFPDKTYGDVTFPAGAYEALRIEIGQAKGHNWWCCLYPNLCFIDATHAVVPEKGKEELKSVLTDEEYDMVTATSEFKIKWFLFQEE